LWQLENPSKSLHFLNFWSFEFHLFDKIWPIKEKSKEKKKEKRRSRGMLFLSQQNPIYGTPHHSLDLMSRRRRTAVSSSSVCFVQYPQASPSF
jgi:hypothetical protein